MSFSINTNILAMSALRNMGVISNRYSQSVERLSSGLRINSAKDDPAGIIASENFRSDITSVNQAIRNTQDSISLAKTAEGGLDHMAALLKEAKALAISSANDTSVSESKRFANQNALSSILQSINKIADNTTFANKPLLGRKAGMNATFGSYISMWTDNRPTVWTMDFSSGYFAGREITRDAEITMEVTVNADYAVLPGVQAYGSANDAIGQEGSFILNGVTFEYKATDTVQKVINDINFKNLYHYAIASFNSGTGTIDLEAMFTGSFFVTLDDTNGIIGAAGYSDAYSTVGVEANVTMDPDGLGAVTVTFSNWADTGWGSYLVDEHGNNIHLNDYYARTGSGPVGIGSVTFDVSRFQTGTNAPGVSTFKFDDFRAKNLGTGVVAGKSLVNIDLTTIAGTTEALQIIDKAIQEVDTKRSGLAAFEKYTLESSISSLNTELSSLTAIESNIRDADVAEEMAEFTKSQMLLESAASVLAQANTAPNSVLALLDTMNSGYADGFSNDYGSVFSYA